jgi:membrane protein insertase Oxa1/YidC/SpoIIIJ
MYRESEKNLELEKKILELKAELKNEQEKAEILNKMLELAKINPSGLANLIDGLPAKD